MIDSKSGGGGKNYYDLPPNSEQLLDLIEHVNMNGNIKDIFKACYRLGRKKGISREYDLRKMALYSLRELGRELGRKDYIQLADEVIGHHDKVTSYIIGDLETTQHIAPEGFDFEEPITDISVASKVGISLLLNELPYTLRHASTRVIILDPTDDSLISITFNSYEEFWTWVESVTNIKKDEK